MRLNRLAALVISIGLAACSTPNTTFAPRELRNGGVAAKSALALYVANEYGINVYALGSKRLLRSLTGSFYASLALDKAANLYALAVFHDTASIRVFRPGATRPSYSIEKLRVGRAMAISPSDGDLYVGNVSFPDMDDGKINVYAPGSAAPKRIIRTKDRLEDLTFDGSGNLYVLAATPTYSASFVAIYKPGASTPFREIGGLTNPGVIAVDRSDNLYVTNCATTGKITCSIVVYARGASQPTRVITDGIRRPYAIAFNSHGDLYVGNQTAPGTVAVYGPGATVPKHVIPAIPGKVPIGLDFAPNDELYVLSVGTSRRGGGAVNVYARDLRLKDTIKQSSAPNALVIGPG